MGVESSALWKNRSFLLLWLAQLTANIGDQCYSFALLWYLLQATQSGTALSLLAIPEMAAGLLFYLIGGVLADRYNPRSLMVGADLARISVAVLVGIMTALGVKQFAFFLAAQFLIGVFSSLFHPARTVALKAIVPIEQLSRSNAILDTTFRTVRIAAPMTIGVIAARVPLSTLFFINAFAYLLSACFLYALGKIPRSGQETVTSRLSAGQYIRDIGYGLKELQTNRLLFVILLFSNMGFLVWQVCWNVGFPFLANEMGQGDSSMLAVLIGFYGIGNLLGSLFMARLQYQRHLLVIIAGWLVQAVGFLLLTQGLALHWLAFLAAAIAGVGGPLIGIPTVTAIQTKAADSNTGKIYALNMLMFTGFSMLSSSMGALWLGTWPVKELFFASGLFLAIMCALGLALERKARQDKHQSFSA
ncbi:MFS transporter [Brevibacillus borstelensis]|jgi:MFS transporter, DHA3 family, macrolide efflux protein|uniref:MFS transporter n=1 Tax=Brevibacillus TaxID=55080 RepID=UPI0014901B40|nr:MFS transporter [Brevibacillus borstelensis]MBE5395496.1 MFS transporter [Brevibacillus borstelensis]MCM3470488.1 MFS transporter [Brevibacillus borstelensis]MCM3558042.1 MFS transporter [Brevibacillus borstelensis]MCM3592018.1 MFS transporter [Brevibacillus borstelensis]MCM3622181.1 MFS transporter [Brevibacillus borstelensis]